MMEDELVSIQKLLTSMLDAHREVYDIDCVIFDGCACGWNNGSTADNDGYTEHVASVIVEAIQDRGE